MSVNLSCLIQQINSSNRVNNLLNEDYLANKQTIEKIGCGVYFLLKDEEVVYVGKSKNIGLRVKGHADESTKIFDSFSYILCNEYDLSNLEGAYVSKLNPKYNRNLPDCDLKRVKFIRQKLNNTIPTQNILNYFKSIGIKPTDVNGKRHYPQSVAFQAFLDGEL